MDPAKRAALGVQGVAAQDTSTSVVKRSKAEYVSNKSSALQKQQEIKSRIVSVESALAFIEKKQDLTFTESECFVLEQLRRWAPLPDLITVQTALGKKRSELISATTLVASLTQTESEDAIVEIEDIGVNSCSSSQ